MPMAAMARREQELGYPSSHPHSPSDVGFTLPSINDVGLLDSGPQITAPNSNINTSAVSLPKFGNGREIVSPKSIECSTSTSTSTKDGKRPEPGSAERHQRKTTGQRPESTPSSPVPSPTPTPVKPPTPSPRLFSTWLPDDSLPFIQTRLLSIAEKVTLERRMSETKSPPTNQAPLPPIMTSSPIPSPIGVSRPLSPPHQQAHQQKGQQQRLSPPAITESPMDRHLPRPENLEIPPSRPISDTFTQRPVPSPPPLVAAAPAPRPQPASVPRVPAPYASPLSSLSLRRPSQLRRAHTTDLDLLRQVKSNNLTLPLLSSTSSSGPPAGSNGRRESEPLFPASAFTSAPLHQPQSQLRTLHHHPFGTGSAYDPRTHTHTGPVPHTQFHDRHHYHSATLHPHLPPTSQTNEGQKQKRYHPHSSLPEPVSPRSIHPSRELHDGTTFGHSHGHSQNWPRSESRPFGGEEGRVGHPYSRESGVSRIRGGHGFRHQR